MKTDLAKILSVSGHHGLFLFLAQSRTGAIAEALSDKKRTAFDAHSRISTLSDIAIFTSEGEMRLAEVFTAMKKAADEEIALAKKKSEQDVQREIVGVAIAASEAVLGREVNKEDEERLLADFVNEVKK